MSFVFVGDMNYDGKLDIVITGFAEKNSAKSKHARHITEIYVGTNQFLSGLRSKCFLLVFLFV
jgi:hypothetical protein